MNENDGYIFKDFLHYTKTVATWLHKANMTEAKLKNPKTTWEQILSHPGKIFGWYCIEHSDNVIWENQSAITQVLAKYNPALRKEIEQADN